MSEAQAFNPIGCWLLLDNGRIEFCLDVRPGGLLMTNLCGAGGRWQILDIGYQPIPADRRATNAGCGRHDFDILHPGPDTVLNGYSYARAEWLRQLADRERLAYRRQSRVLLLELAQRLPRALADRQWLDLQTNNFLPDLQAVCNRLQEIQRRQAEHEQQIDELLQFLRRFDQIAGNWRPHSSPCLEELEPQSDSGRRAVGA